MRFRDSIVGNFIIAVLMVLVVGQGVLWFWFMFFQKSHNVRMLQDKILSTGNHVADMSATAIKEGGFQGIEHLLQRVVAGKDILGIRVKNLDGGVLIEKGEFSRKKSSTLNPLFVPDVMVMEIPVRDGAREVGSVVISYSGDMVNDSMWLFLMVPPIGQLLVFVLMAIAIYVFFQKKLGKPLMLLNDKIELITAGNLTVEIPKMGIGELDVIAGGLKFLIAKLSSTVLKLNSTADNVAMAIKQLNLTFGNVIAGVQKESSAITSIADSFSKASGSQIEITRGTEKLSEFTSENVTSLLEMKATADEIVSSTGKLFEASENSYSIVAEMLQTAKTMNENSQSVLASVQDTSSAVEQITVSVKEVENNAKRSSELAENVRKCAADEGLTSVAGAVEGMNKISDKVKYSVDIVRRLGARSNDIEKMLTVIKEVTEQTNLLSLNAAILAAQAGEYGKGFSVVSDEIQALSDRTAASAKEISGIVKTIKAEINEAVVSIESGMHMVDEGGVLVNKAGESMGTIVEAAQGAARMTGMIERATEEQAKGLRQVSMSVEEIKAMAGQMAKSTDEQYKGSEFMLERGGDVKDVAEAVKKGTEEQAAGTRIISRNLELASERINEINQAAMDQRKFNEGITSHMDKIKESGESTLKDVETVSVSLGILQEEIDMLRKEMETFKVR